MVRVGHSDRVWITVKMKVDIRVSFGVSVGLKVRVVMRVGVSGKVRSRLVLGHVGVTVMAEINVWTKTRRCKGGLG